VQAGFKKGMGTNEQIFTLHTIIQSKLKDPGGKLFTAFVDMKEAFSTPAHKKLWERMKELGVGKKMLQLLQQIYINADAVVRSQDGLTDPFPINKGILQGESASSIIFNLFLDSVVAEMNDSDVAAVAIGSYLVHLLLFVDDICLMGNTADQLQKKINILAESFSKLGMIVNISKTKVVFAKRKVKEDPNIYWNGVKLEVVDEYVYLGVIFHRSGHFKRAHVMFTTKAAAAAAKLRDVCKKAKIPKIYIHKQLHMSLVKSVFLYGSPSWGVYMDEDKLDQPNCQYWKKLLKLPKSTPGYVVRLETGTTHTMVQVMKGILRFIVKQLRREEGSLLSQCLQWQLRWASRIQDPKRCWGHQLKTWLKITGDEDLLSLPFHQLKEILPLITTEIVGKLKTFLTNKDTRRMVNSTWTPGYAKVKSHVTTENYLEQDLSLPELQMIAQTRVNLLRICYQDKKISLLSTDLCPFCHQEHEANLQHYFTECPMLQDQIIKLHDTLPPALPNETFTADFFTHIYNKNKNNSSFFKSLFFFWSSIFRLIE
jgi:hypothetical protein